MEDYDDVWKIQFGILSPDQLIKYSTCEVSKPISYNICTENTPYDERMGVIECGVKCPSCGQDNMNCPGHFGHIILEKSVFNMKFISTIVHILRCICPKCSELRVHKNMILTKNVQLKKGISRLRLISDISEKIHTCHTCNSGIPHFFHNEKQNKYAIQYSWDKKEGELSADDVYHIFLRMTDETFKLMGFNENLIHHENYIQGGEHVHKIRPESLVIKVLPVIPICARPWAITESEKRHDDITDKYNTILQLNQALKKNHTIKKKNMEFDRTMIERKLSEHVSTLFDNRKGVSRVSVGGRKHKGLVDRLEGKEGRINSELGGKRVDFSARSVIVGGPMLKINELGIPEHIASELTIPERVFALNIDRLQKTVDRGKANYVIRNGKKIRLDIVTAKFTRHYPIRDGDIVERHLRDGDVVEFNRQPTLRLESKMTFSCKIMRDEYAFRLPLAVTKAFNADFDGDEMNLHCPQSIDAIAECSTLMKVENMILAPQKNAPIIGPVQDCIVGSYLLTQTWEPLEDTNIPIHWLYDVFENLKPQFTWQGFLQRASKYWACVNQRRGQYFIEGLHVSGKLAISIVFPEKFWYSHTTQVHPQRRDVIIREGIMVPNSGPLCKKTIGPTANSTVHDIAVYHGGETCVQYISNLQFCIDFLLPRMGFSMGISDCFITRPEMVEDIVRQSTLTSERIIHGNDVLDKETEINNVLNNAISLGTKLGKYIVNGRRNRLNIMIESGAKGSPINSTQICGLLGQQNVDGGRIPKTLSGGTRSLYCFKKNDEMPEARGFVKNSYITGLSPSETFFHAVGGRRGLTDTAVKTAETGYCGKKMDVKMYDFKAYIDGSVKNVNQRVIQILYGGDGFAPERLHYSKYCRTPFFVAPEKIVSRMRALYPECHMRNLSVSEKDALFDAMKLHEKSLTIVHRRSNANIVKVLGEMLDTVAVPIPCIPEFCKIIVEKFYTAKVQYGECVGLRASSSIQEIGTQLTLNTFHYAGLSEADVTLGFPRFNELLSTTIEPAKTSSKVYFKKRIEDPFEMYDFVKQKINKYVRRELSFFIDDMHMFYVKEGECKPEQSRYDFYEYEEFQRPEWLDTYERHFGKKPYTSWVVVLDMNKQKLFDSRLSLYEIASAIETESSNGILCACSPQHMGQIQVYIQYEEISPPEKLRNGLTENNWRYHIARDVAKEWLNALVIRGPSHPALFSARGKRKKNVDITDGFVVKAGDGKWFASLKGSNIVDILGDEDVDASKTECDDLWAINQMFGIQAAKHFLVSEICKVMSFGGGYVNPRHVELLVDSMTFTGALSSVSRYGIDRNVGPMAKCMFEKPVENLCESAMMGECDDMNSFSANLAMGKRVMAGTGEVHLLG